MGMTWSCSGSACVDPLAASLSKAKPQTARTSFLLRGRLAGPVRDIRRHLPWNDHRRNPRRDPTGNHAAHAPKRVHRDRRGRARPRLPADRHRLRTGSITARLANTSGANWTGITVDFDWIYRNNGDRSNALSFSWSTDNVNFTTISAANLTTPALLDAAGLLVGTPQALKVLRADADAGVGDDDLQHPVIAVGGDRHLAAARGPRVRLRPDVRAGRS